MSKRNKIFRNLQAHLKNEFDLNDATARTFAKRALSEFRSSGSKAITRTSPLCTDELPAVTCDDSSKFRTIEGLCNNLGSPYFGAFDTKFIREIEVDPYDAKAITISDPSKYLLSINDFWVMEFLVRVFLHKNQHIKSKFK